MLLNDKKNKLFAECSHTYSVTPNRTSCHKEDDANQTFNEQISSIQERKRIVDDFGV